MKYLKTFEELSPEVYQSAAKKFRDRGEEEKAMEIEEYINSDFYKEFITRQDNDPKFRQQVINIVDGLKDVLRHLPQWKEKGLGYGDTWKELSQLAENADKLESECEEGDGYKLWGQCTPEEKKTRIKNALVRIGIGAGLIAVFTVAISIGASMSVVGIIGAVATALIGHLSSLTLFQTSIALSPQKP